MPLDSQYIRLLLRIQIRLANGLALDNRLMPIKADFDLRSDSCLDSSGLAHSDHGVSGSEESGVFGHYSGPFGGTDCRVY